ncbi:MAG: twin-arginine translocation signal domain-containing protein [Gemmataceae bacterium]|nr:twin-arginine translocation signal domain-containing protein [Gemmataceae bacterium]
MLTIHGEKHGKLCNGVTRRDFLTLGALGAAGLALPDLLQLQAQVSAPTTAKSVIMVYQPVD